MRTRFSPVLVLALALVLTSALPAQAAPRSSAEPQRLFSQLVSFLGKIPGRLVSLWEMIGSTVDPFGGGGTTPPVSGNGAETPGPLDGPVDR